MLLFFFFFFCRGSVFLFLFVSQKILRTRGNIYLSQCCSLKDNPISKFLTRKKKNICFVAKSDYGYNGTESSRNYTRKPTIQRKNKEISFMKTSRIIFSLARETKLGGNTVHSPCRLFVVNQWVKSVANHVELPCEC